MRLKKRKMMAELRIDMDCGDHIITYVPCNGSKDMIRTLKKSHEDGIYYINGFSVDDSRMVYAGSKLHEVN